MVQLVVLVSNRCGVLARVTSVISSVGANIRRCHVTEVPDSAMSVLSLGVQADEPQARAILRKLGRLIEVVEAVCDTDDGANTRCFRDPKTGLREGECPQAIA